MSGAAPDVIVDSVTGIDVSLAVAGPGARAYAFLVDWHIRLLVALAWFVVGTLLYNGRLSLAPPAVSDPRWFGAVLAPALGVYFLYHPVIELAMRGSTPGKRLAGVRLIARNGSAPSAGALLARNVFRLLDSLPLCYGVGLISVILTRDHLRIGDMAAGTLLVFERSDARLPAPAGQVAQASRLDAAGAEIVTELIERWPTLAPEARVRLARQVLTRYGGDAGAPGGSESGGSDGLWRARLERLVRPER